MKYVMNNIMNFFILYISFCPSFVSTLPVSFYLPLCVSACLSEQQSTPLASPNVHSNSAQHSFQQHRRVGQVAAIYIGPQSRLSFTEAVIVL